MKTYSRPHFAQAHRWHRFARILKQVRAYAYSRKESALEWSLDRKAHGFAVPAVLQCLPVHSRGLHFLQRQLDETDFPELEAKAVYDDGADVMRVELFVHVATAQGTEKAPVGILPEADARWMLPLLREDLPPRIFVCALEHRGYDKPAHMASVTVAIARPDKDGRQWIDAWSNRKAARQEPTHATPSRYGTRTSRFLREKLTQMKSELHRMQANAAKRSRRKLDCSFVNDRIEKQAEQVENLRAVVVERECRERDRLAQEMECHEVAMTDLPPSDYWQVATRI